MTVWIVLAINMLMWHLNSPRAEKWASMQQYSPSTSCHQPAACLWWPPVFCLCFLTHTFLFIFVFIWLREKTSYSWKSAADHQSLASNCALLLWILLSWRGGSGFFLVEYFEIASCFCLFLLCITHLCYEGVVVAGSGSTWKRQAAKVNAVSHAPVLITTSRMKFC